MVCKKYASRTIFGTLGWGGGVVIRLEAPRSVHEYYSQKMIVKDGIDTANIGIELRSFFFFNPIAYEYSSWLCAQFFLNVFEIDYLSLITFLRLTHLQFDVIKYNYVAKYCRIYSS